MLFDTEADDCTLFTPGPVMTHESTRSVGGSQMVYHRTAEFSGSILKCEQMLKRTCGARAEDHLVMLAGSGTAAMEAAVVNLFKQGDKVLVVNSGDFGYRFAEICRLHGLDVTEIKVEPGRQVCEEDLRNRDVSLCAGLLMNHHETSTGSLLNLDLIARFCRDYGLLLVVDAIGSFLADPLTMDESGIDALIVSSQKGLALPPGMSFIILSDRSVERVRNVPCRSYYFGFQKYLDDMRRGQTPFTPPVGIVRQLETRLATIAECGTNSILGHVAALAVDFRHRIRTLPFRIFPECPSNALTALEPIDKTAGFYVGRLAEQYRISVCPNGGRLKDRIFRVAHIGDLSIKDNARLAAALTELADRNLRPETAIRG